MKDNKPKLLLSTVFVVIMAIVLSVTISSFSAYAHNNGLNGASGENAHYDSLGSTATNGEMSNPANGSNEGN